MHIQSMPRMMMGMKKSSTLPARCDPSLLNQWAKNELEQGIIIWCRWRFRSQNPSPGCILCKYTQLYVFFLKMKNQKNLQTRWDSTTHLSNQQKGVQKAAGRLISLAYANVVGKMLYDAIWWLIRIYPPFPLGKQKFEEESRNAFATTTIL